MQDEAISSSPKGLPRPAKLGIAIAVLVLLYYAITGSIRAYVSSRIEANEGRPMPEFELADRSGKTWTRSDLVGKKTVLNFFRSQCVRCWQEREAIMQLVEESAGGRFQVVGVMMDEVQGFPAELTRKTLARFAYTHPILMADAAFVDAFHGAGWSHVTPVTYIVDAKGDIVRSLRGHQSLETLRAATR